MKALRYLFLAPGIGAIALGVGAAKVATANPWQHAPQTMRIAALRNLPSVQGAIHRNPFDGAPQVAAASTSSSVTSPVTTTLAPGTPSTTSGVPNPGGGADASVPDQGAVVPQSGDATASVYVISTVTGEGKPPLAMLRNGTDTDIVGIGDVIGRRHIVKIVSQGIEFDDGSRLAIATSSSSIATPPSAHGSTALTGGALGAAPNASSSPAVAASTPPTSTQATFDPAPSGPPVIQPSPYKFGPLATPIPGTTPAPVNHYYAPPANSH